MDWVRWATPADPYLIEEVGKPSVGLEGGGSGGYGYTADGPHKIDRAALCVSAGNSRTSDKTPPIASIPACPQSVLSRLRAEAGSDLEPDARVRLADEPVGLADVLREGGLNAC